MSKGQFSLFTAFEKKPQKENGKQRNYLMPVRDTALIHRYFFYGWIKDYKFNRCLNELEKEFFISEARLVDVISNNNATLELLHKNPPRIKELKEKYPWLNWDL